MVQVEAPTEVLAVIAVSVCAGCFRLRGRLRQHALLRRGLQVSRQHLADLEKSLLAASPEERLVLARVSPERADFLLAGATILDRILRTVRKTGLVISDGGLRYGLLS